MENIIGKITEFTDIRYTRKGKTIITFILENRGRQIPCVAYEALAEKIEFNVNEGDILELKGYLENNVYRGMRNFRVLSYDTINAAPILPKPALTNSLVDELIIDGKEHFEYIPHIMNYLNEYNIEYTHKSLRAGDYYRFGSRNIIERKKSLEELVINLSHPEKALSLSKEFRLGLDYGLHWILLVEADISCTISKLCDWETLNQHIPKSNPYIAYPSMLKNVLMTLERKYNMTIYFCKPEEMAEAIKLWKILFQTGEKIGQSTISLYPSKHKAFTHFVTFVSNSPLCDFCFSLCSPAIPHIPFQAKSFILKVSSK
ncbi:MAG: hypothetical protein PHQ72_09595 [Hespellia sp.]|nr:hypothetical protein [Hespellia sp.]